MDKKEKRLLAYKRRQSTYSHDLSLGVLFARCTLELGSASFTTISTNCTCDWFAFTLVVVRKKLGFSNDVYQVPIIDVVAPQPIPTTASVDVPLVSTTCQFFRALRDRRRPSIDAVIESRLEHSTSDRVVSTLPNLEILEHPVRPPPHA